VGCGRLIDRSMATRGFRGSKNLAKMIRGERYEYKNTSLV
jgi:hypothetical protein